MAGDASIREAPELGRHLEPEAALDGDRGADRVAEQGALGEERARGEDVAGAVEAVEPAEEIDARRERLLDLGVEAVLHEEVAALGGDLVFEARGIGDVESLAPREPFAYIICAAEIRRLT